MKLHLSVLPLCLLLGACATPPVPIDSGVKPASQWTASTLSAQHVDQQWWQRFASPELDKLVGQARVGSYDLAAAIARVRQARAASVVASASQLPELTANVNANRQKLLHGSGYSQLDASGDKSAVNDFDANLSASYEIDFWGRKAATRASARQTLKASEFDQATLELTLLSSVADSYLRILALREQGRIARLNLENAHNVLQLVQTHYRSGSATALEVAQQASLVAAQERQVPLIHQQAREALIGLAVLLGQPVQNVRIAGQDLEQLQWPAIGGGLPSELLSRRPDIAGAEARLAAAQADVQVARAAMLPSLTLGATVGSGTNTAADILRSPFYTLTAGLIAPVFNNGRLSAERDQATARQEELLEIYRASIIAAFADVEQALNAIEGLDRQRRWQDEELNQAQRAFEVAQSRYKAGAEGLLTVLDTQRTLYQAQDRNVQLRLSRLQASVALYKALGGGWQVM